MGKKVSLPIANHEAFEFCAERLKALAEPERLRIVEVLFAGERNVGDLAEELGDEMVKVSHHLKVLRNAGLVSKRKDGRFVVYTLHPDVFAATRVVAGKRRLDLGCCQLELPIQSST
jgi:DNA-binding transcriptional ArsR family regulator